MTKFKKFIYDKYNEENCPFEVKRYKKKNDIKSDYTSENKKIFKSFFKLLDKNDFYVVNHLGKDIENPTVQDQDHKKHQPIRSSVNMFHFKKEEVVNGASVQSVKNSKANEFVPTKLYIEENSCYFTKWLSSIFQFIKDFEIYDDVIIFNYKL